MPLGVSSCDSEDVLLTLNFSFIVCGALPHFSIHLLISCAAIFFGSWENLPRKPHRPYRFSSWKRAAGAWVFRGSWDQSGGSQRPSLCWGLEKTPSLCNCQRLRFWARVLNPSCAEEAAKFSLWFLEVQILTSFIFYGICESCRFHE